MLRYRPRNMSRDYWAEVNGTWRRDGVAQPQEDRRLLVAVGLERVLEHVLERFQPPALFAAGGTGGAAAALVQFRFHFWSD